MKTSGLLDFRTLRSARSFLRGFCVPRVIVSYRGTFYIVAPSTAKRHGLRPI